MSPDVSYEMCGHTGCWHFVDGNPAFGDYPGLAEYDHLDDGEKEHDHDATPSGVIRTLAEWQGAHPELFTAYGDGKIGPNSALFPVRPEPEATRGGAMSDLKSAEQGRRVMIAPMSADEIATVERLIREADQLIAEMVPQLGATHPAVEGVKGARDFLRGFRATGTWTAS